MFTLFFLIATVTYCYDNYYQIVSQLRLLPDRYNTYVIVPKSFRYYYHYILVIIALYSLYHCN